MTFQPEQRVKANRTLEFLRSDFAVPVGSPGTVKAHNAWPGDRTGTYGVVFDHDPHQLPTLCWPEDLNPI